MKDCYIKIEDRLIFDSIPLPTVIVDDDGQVLDANEALYEFISNKESIVYRRFGDAVRCVQSFVGSRGCGTAPTCEVCKIKNAVKEAIETKKTTKMRTKFIVSRLDGQEAEYEMIITARTINNSSIFVLVILDNITDIC